MKKVLFFLLTAGFILGCSKSSKATLHPTPALRKVTEPKQLKSVNPGSTRNPFLPEFASKSLGSSVSSSEAKLSTQSYSNFKLLGTLTGTPNPRALLGLVSGETWVVHPGSKIGREDALVVEIADREITLRSKGVLKVLSMGGV